MECTIFELDGFTKHSIFKSPNNEFLYAKNIHFGWMICGGNGFNHFSNSQIKMAENNIGKKIILNDRGHKDDSTVFHQNDLKLVNIGVTMSARDMIPSVYL